MNNLVEVLYSNYYDEQKGHFLVDSYSDEIRFALEHTYKIAQGIKEDTLEAFCENITKNVLEANEQGFSAGFSAAVKLFFTGQLYT